MCVCVYLNVQNIYIYIVALHLQHVRTQHIYFFSDRQMNSRSGYLIIIYIIFINVAIYPIRWIAE